MVVAALLPCGIWLALVLGAFWFPFSSSRHHTSMDSPIQPNQGSETSSVTFHSGSRWHIEQNEFEDPTQSFEGSETSPVIEFQPGVELHESEDPSASRSSHDWEIEAMAILWG